jgi:hypothetical protein
VITKPVHRNEGGIRAGFESVLDGSLAVLTCEEVLQFAAKFSMIAAEHRLSCQVTLGSASGVRSITVSLESAVDLSTAVIAYRPAAGEERSVSADKVSPAALFHAAPWRTFRWYFGQRHYSGTYWSATQRDHVIYESRLELANLLFADFNPAVCRIVAQPFLLCAEVDGQARKHIPDYLWDSESGPVVVDVIRVERMIQPKVVLLCAWTRRVVESLGWSYLVLNEPPRIRLSNLRFLAGYRRNWLINQSLLDEMRGRLGGFTGMSIADAEQTVRGYPRQLVRPALMHLLWRHECCADLDVPLGPSTVLEVPE